MGPLGAGDERVARGVEDLPDVTAPAVAAAEALAVSDRVEQLNRELGVGEGDHGISAGE
jgi:hypothetical protein